MVHDGSYLELGILENFSQVQIRFSIGRNIDNVHFSVVDSFCGW